MFFIKKICYNLTVYVTLYYTLANIDPYSYLLNRENLLTEDSTGAYLVYASSLSQLLSRCFNCTKTCQAHITYKMGSMVRVLQNCAACDNKFAWDSQPMAEGHLPHGNLLIGSALFARCVLVIFFSVLLNTIVFT